MDGIWRLRDTTDDPKLARREEWIPCGLPPDRVDQVVKDKGAPFFALATLTPGRQLDPLLRDRYKALGYRLGFTQPLMAHALEATPSRRSPADVQRVLTAELADRIAKAARQRLLLPAHLAASSRLRLYAALVDGRLAGWVRSATIDRSTWCSNMYVKAEYRRQGIATALLAAMLEDDRASGATAAFLLASHDGSKLYDAIGYQTLGLMALFTPRRAPPPRA